MVLFFFIHFIIPFGKFRPHYLGKATAAARAALPSPTNACWIFSCFRNPPNFDRDYRVFNVRAYTHGVGHTHESAQHFNSENLTIFSGASDRGIRTSGLWISSPSCPKKEYIL